MPTPYVIIGNAGNRRVDLFQQALTARGLPPARLIAYRDLIARRVTLPEIVAPGSILRIESPGKDSEVERDLLIAGADVPDSPAFARISREEAQRLPMEKGRILYPRQWYLGYCQVLAEIERQRALCPPHTLMNHPDDIAAMFDKRVCHRRMREAQVMVPRDLGPVGSYEELIMAMRRERCPRVFVKLAHGSSASGVVALQISERQQLATTTVELVQTGDELQLYNSRRLRTYRDAREIAMLIDALCRYHVHVEQWLPKAGIDDRICDLRVVVIGGRIRHVVVRLSRSPMTNLHLLNARGSFEAVLERMGMEAWEAACQTCLQAMACFPQSLYAGIDLLISPGYQRHAVLEINAFGDLLPGVLHEDEDTYSAEIGVCRQAGLAAQHERYRKSA
jgi:glutathione synthase/RimK-type ligase-like ATP-grasp enzyme